MSQKLEDESLENLKGTRTSLTKPKGAASEGTSAAARSASVLYALADEPAGISVRSLAEATGTSRSAAHRILQSLAEDGYALQSAEGHYAVGPKLFQLASRVFAGSTIIGIADSIMHRLVDEVGETVYLAMLVPQEQYGTFVHRVECSKAIRFVQPLGGRLPLHAGAVGKAMLAAQAEIDLSNLELPAYTSHTLSTPAHLKAELEATTKRGFAVSVEERVEGAAGVAAAISTRWGVIGALTITIPVNRIPADGLESIGPKVRKSADEISEVLAATGTLRF